MIPDNLLIRPVWAEVNLDNLAHNMREVRRIVPRSSLIMAAVKADGYGHGVKVTSETFLANGADRLAVATPDEGFQLRDLGIKAPILCLGYTPNYFHEKAMEVDVTTTVYDYEQGLHLNEVALELNRRAKFHVKIDTGMGRLGFLPNKETVETIVKLSKLPGLELEGVFTHFAVADEADKSYTCMQHARYMDIIVELHGQGVDIPIKHVSNSAAIIDLPEYSLDMVRPGIMLYGFYPSPYVDHKRVDLKQVMTFHAQISHVKMAQAGQGISYGLSYKTEKASKIATIPVGYADGYRRSLSNRGWVEVAGKKAKVIGRVCMDQFMVNVTDVPEVKQGDLATLIGYPGGIAPDGEEMATLLDTITHEVTCQLTKRVPRVYTRMGKPVEVWNYLT